jgi:hypothetical protein
MKKILILLMLVILLTACNLPNIGGKSSSEGTEAPATQAGNAPGPLPPSEPTSAEVPATQPIDGTEMNLGVCI